MGAWVQARPRPRTNLDQTWTKNLNQDLDEDLDQNLGLDLGLSEPDLEPQPRLTSQESLASLCAVHTSTG